VARLFTSESVTEGHPDKICDQISDDPRRDAAAGPARARRRRDDGDDGPRARRRGGDHRGLRRDPRLVRDTVLGIGYDSSVEGLRRAPPAASRSRSASRAPTSPRASTRPTRAAPAARPATDKQGAGDQGLMFGYACDDTPELMPLPIFLAHRLAERLTAVRKSGQLAYLRPDGKTQVTIAYDGDRPVRLDTVVVSSQHAADVSLEALLAPDVEKHVIEPVLAELADSGTELDTRGLPHAHQPDRQVRDRRPDGRRRADRSQDHRRHLRRHGPPRWRRLLRQGPEQGGPLRGVRHPMGRQERRRRRAGRSLRGAGRLRDRQGAAGRTVRRDLRHRDRRRSDRIQGHQLEVFDLRPGRDHRRTRPAAPIYQ
jgi:hypothetical protein